MTPGEVNDAVSILEENAHVEWQQFLGTAPWDFGFVEIRPRGRFEYERISLASPQRLRRGVHRYQYRNLRRTRRSKSRHRLCPSDHHTGSRTRTGRPCPNDVVPGID